MAGPHPLGLLNSRGRRRREGGQQRRGTGRQIARGAQRQQQIWLRHHSRSGICTIAMLMMRIVSGGHWLLHLDKEVGADLAQMILQSAAEKAAAGELGTRRSQREGGRP